jgi:hypothetical protein
MYGILLKLIHFLEDRAYFTFFAWFLLFLLGHLIQVLANNHSHPGDIVETVKGALKNWHPIWFFTHPHPLWQHNFILRR